MLKGSFQDGRIEEWRKRSEGMSLKEDGCAAHVIVNRLSRRVLQRRPLSRPVRPVQTTAAGWNELRMSH